MVIVDGEDSVFWACVDVEEAEAQSVFFYAAYLGYGFLHGFYIPMLEQVMDEAVIEGVVGVVDLEGVGGLETVWFKHVLGI